MRLNGDQQTLALGSSYMEEKYLRIDGVVPSGLPFSASEAFNFVLPETIVISPRYFFEAKALSCGDGSGHILYLLVHL